MAFWLSILSAMLGLTAAPLSQGEQIRYVYDEAGRLIQMTKADGSGTAYQYDAVGNILAVRALASNAVSITEFTPNAAAVSAQVTVYGNGFDQVAANNAVKFNGVTAVVSAATKTSLTVLVPAGATTGKISVTNAAGSAQSASDFMVSADLAPTISGFTPAAGPGGMVVTVNGTNFSARTADNRVTFGQITASSTAVSSTQVSATVPAVAASGKIALSTIYGKAVSSTDFYALPAGVTVADVEFYGRLTVGGAAQTVQINTAGKKAIVLFDGLPKQMLSLLGVGSTFASGINVAVYRPDGTVVSSGTVNSNTTLDFNPLPQPGTYTMLISSVGSGAGHIDLQLKAEDTGTLTIDGPAREISLSAGQNGRYTFAGVAGQHLGAGYTNVNILPAPAYIYYRFYNPDGTLLFSDYWSANNSNDLPTLPVTGIYSVQVDPTNAIVANLSLSLLADLSGQLTADGSTTTFNSTRVGQNGRYTFNASAGQRYVLAFNAPTFASSVTITVAKPDGSTLVSTSVSTAASKIELPAIAASGVYTVLITPTGTITGKVDLQLTTVAADLLGTIDIDGAPVPLSLSMRQHALLTFSGTAGQHLGMGYTNLVVPAGQSVTYTVFKPDGTQLFSDYWTTNNSNNLPVLPVSGNYKLLVQQTQFSDASVTVTLSSDQGGVLVSDAPALTFNSGRVGQNGRFTFDGTLGQKAWLKLTGGTFPSSVSVYVYKPDGTLLFSGSVTSSLSLDLGALPVAGTYTVFIDPLTTVTGKVDVQLVGIPQDITADISIDGASVALNLGERQRAVLTFAGVAGQHLGLGYTNLVVPAGQSVTYTVFKPDGTQLFTDYWTTNNSNNLPVLPVSGTYKLVVQQTKYSAASVTVALLADQSETLVRDGAPVTLDASRVGRNGRFTFDGTAGQRSWLKLTAGTFPSSVSVYVYKPDGTTLVSSAVTTSVNLDLGGLPVSGTYTVFIDPVTSVTGKVDVQLVGVTPDITGDIAINGDSVSLNLGVRQRAVLTFAGAAGQYLGLGYTNLVVPAGQSVTYTVFKPDGTQLFTDYSTTNNSNNLPVLPVSGNYKLVVQQTMYSTAAVAITLSADLGSALVADAPAVTFSTTRVGQNGRYTFNAVASQKYIVKLTNFAFPAGITLYTYKPDGSLMYTNSVTSSTTLDLGLMPVSGTYTLFFDLPNTTIGNIDVQVLGAPDIMATIAIDGNPVLVSLGIRQRAVLTFAGTAGQRLGMGYTDVSTSPVGQVVGYTVFKPDGTQLFADSWTNNNSGDLPALPVSGSYTLVVQQNGWGTTATTVALSADVGGTLVAGAAPVTLLTRVGQNIRQTFACTAGQSYQLLLSAGTYTASVTVNVLKPDGTSLVSSTFTNSATINVPASTVGGNCSVLITPTGALSGQVAVQLK